MPGFVPGEMLTGYLLAPLNGRPELFQWPVRKSVRPAPTSLDGVQLLVPFLLEALDELIRAPHTRRLHYLREIFDFRRVSKTDVFRHRQRKDRMLLCEQRRRVVQILWNVGLGGLPPYEYLSRGGSIELGEKLDDRRLSAAVGADDDDERGRGDFEG